jgi:hypothetical protein
MVRPETFLNEPSDCQWLRETHLKNTADVPPFASFAITGNEDCPLSIVLYDSADPLVTDQPIARYRLEWDDAREYVKE